MSLDKCEQHLTHHQKQNFKEKKIISEIKEKIKNKKII
jgi:hypothetical protein